MPEAIIEDEDEAQEVDRQREGPEPEQEYEASVQEEPVEQVAAWQRSPETGEELDYETFTPSEQYSKAYDVLQKDLVLSNLNRREQMYIQLSAQNDSDLAYLEQKEGFDLSSLREFILRDTMTMIESSRAIDGQTLKLLKTNIQKYTGSQTVTQKRGSKKGFIEKLQEKAPRRRR